MGNKPVAKVVIGDKVTTIETHDHAEPHRPIFDVGHSTLHYDEDVPIGQHGYFFQPHMEPIVDHNKGAAKKMYNMYVKHPSGDDGRLYFVTRRTRDEAYTLPPYMRDHKHHHHEHHSGTATVPTNKRGSVVMSGPPAPSAGNRRLRVVANAKPEDEFMLDSDDDEDIDDPTLDQQLEEQQARTNRDMEVHCKICDKHPTDPHIAPCGHICCKQCWKNLFRESVGSDLNCPDCGKHVEPEQIKSQVLCTICRRVPESPQKSACGHVACQQCWSEYLRDASQCPECAKEVVPDQLTKM